MRSFSVQLLGSVCLLLSACGGGTGSESATLQSAPQILKQPAATTVAAGGNATLAVQAIGGSLTYVWTKDGVFLPGQSSTMVLTSLDATDEGDYQVTVRNGMGSVTSLPARLRVTGAPPVITSQPQSVVVREGDSATFTVAAAGKGLTYQWFEDGRDDDDGTEGPILTVSSVSAQSVGSYQVVVSNEFGATQSAAVTLTLAP